MGFDAETIQKLLGTYWAFEPLIEEIHPEFRIDNPATLSLRRGTVFMREGDEALKPLRLPHEKRTPLGGLEWLLAKENSDLWRLASATESYREWPKYVSPHNGHITYNDPVGETRPAVSVKNLRYTWGGPKQTVEFRQHTMTFDNEHVYQWLRFCAGLVEFAGDVNMEALKPFLDEYMDGSREFSLKEALNEIGMRREGLYFGAVIEKKRSEVKSD